MFPSLLHQLSCHKNHIHTPSIPSKTTPDQFADHLALYAVNRAICVCVLCVCECSVCGVCVCGSTC